MPRGGKRSKPVKKLKQTTLTESFSSSSVSSPAKPNRTSSGNTHVPAPRISSEEEEDDVTSEEVRAIHFEPEASSDGDDSSYPLTQHLAGRKGKEIVIISSEEESESKTGFSVDGKRKRKEVKSKLALSSSDEEPPPTRRRKLVKGTRPPSPSDNDVDLLDEVDEDQIIDARFRTRNKKSLFQKNLEKIKRKKLGKPAISSSESDEHSDEEVKSDVVPIPGSKPRKDGSGSDSLFDDTIEQEEDSFIVEDGGAVAELPAAFSMSTHQDLIHHFKVICQLFVHLAVRPRAERREFITHVMQENQYFAVPLQIARRKLDGLRDSLVISSVWRPSFKKPLETYPVLEIMQLDYAVPSCDACHLGGRTSTRLGRLGGIPYDRVTYESLEDSPSESSDKDNEDEEGPAKEFNLGRFCAARTVVFHKFMHWEYALFTSLEKHVDEGRDDGEHSFVRVAYANGRKPPKDPTDADGFVDWLDQRGIIDMEWQNVREMMERARNLEMIVKRGEDID